MLEKLHSFSNVAYSEMLNQLYVLCNAVLACARLSFPTLSQLACVRWGSVCRNGSAVLMPIEDGRNDTALTPLRVAPTGVP